MHDSRYFIVSGRVQGVSFRAAACEAARALGLRGWVRNRRDGCVEGVACGEDAALTDFRDWLARGPPAARVEHVQFEPTSVTSPGDDFVIR